MNPPPPPPPQTTGVSTRSASAVRKLLESENNYLSSKIPFRPRKRIRKLTSTSNSNSDSSQSSSSSSLIVVVSPKSLSTKSEMDVALGHLRDRDPLLAALIAAHPPPKLSPCNSSPFLSLSKSIIFQQLAAKAAKAIYDRFVSLCGAGAGAGDESNVLPSTVLSLTPQRLREIGVSARKASYLHDLAHKFSAGMLSDASILAMAGADDEAALLEKLTAVKGIGPWSVHMFMIFSLHRPDVLPVGDLGVRKGVQILHGLKELPKPLQMEQICEKWRPYRSVGSWYMWRLLEAS